MADISGNH